MSFNIIGYLGYNCDTNLKVAFKTALFLQTEE